MILQAAKDRHRARNLESMLEHVLFKNQEIRKKREIRKETITKTYERTVKTEKLVQGAIPVRKRQNEMENLKVRQSRIDEKRLEVKEKRDHLKMERDKIIERQMRKDSGEDKVYAEEKGIFQQWERFQRFRYEGEGEGEEVVEVVSEVGQRKETPGLERHKLEREQLSASRKRIEEELLEVDESSKRLDYEKTELVERMSRLERENEIHEREMRVLRQRKIHTMDGLDQITDNGNGSDSESSIVMTDGEHLRVFEIGKGITRLTTPELDDEIDWEYNQQPVHLHYHRLGKTQGRLAQQAQSSDGEDVSQDTDIPMQQPVRHHESQTMQTTQRTRRERAQSYERVSPTQDCSTHRRGHHRHVHVPPGGFRGWVRPIRHTRSHTHLRSRAREEHG